MKDGAEKALDALENKLDQAKGRMKETAGQIVGSQELELEGKAQRMAGKLAGAQAGRDIRRKAAQKANGLLDRLDEKLDEVLDGREE